MTHIFIIEKNYDQARTALSKLDHEAKQQATVLNDLGVLHYLQKDYTGAEQLFNQSIAVDNTFVEAYYNLALALQQNDKIPEAIKVLDTYLQLEQDEGWHNAAKELYVEDPENEINKKIEKTINQTYSLKVAILTEKANQLRTSENLDGAVEEYKKVLKLVDNFFESELKDKNCALREYK